MKVFKKALLGICSFACALTCGFGFATANNQVEAAADNSTVQTHVLKIDNSAHAEYYFHNKTAIEEGQDFTIEFTVEELVNYTNSNGLFGATGTTAETWNYSTAIASANYYSLFQNGETETELTYLQEDVAFRFYYQYQSSGDYAGKYQMLVYRDGVLKWNNKYGDYQPYMGLYFANLGFDMTLTGVKCYQGSGTSAIDLGLYTDAEGTEFFAEDGASVRLSKPTGFGFTSRISYANYNDAVATYGAANVSTGTLIAMTSDVSSLASFTHANLDTAGVKYLDVVNKGFKNASTASTDGYYAWRGSVVNMYEHNYENDFSAVGYLCVNGEYTYTAYDSEDNSRNVQYVAQAAYSDVSEASDDNYTSLIEDGAHTSVGQYSPYTADELSLLKGYFEDVANLDDWWSSTKFETYPLQTITKSEDNTWEIGLTFASNGFAYGVFTLDSDVLEDLVENGCTSMKLTFAPKANQAAGLALYKVNPTSMMSNTNMSATYTVDLQDAIAGDGVTFMVRAQDISSNTAWGATEALDGITMKATLYKEYNEDIKDTWFTYDELNDGIVYDEDTEAWTFTVANGKYLHMEAEAISKYYAEGAVALSFNVTCKDNQTTGFEFVGYAAAANYVLNFSVDITNTLCTDGLDIQTYYSTIATDGMDTSDGYVIKITPVTILDREDLWMTYSDEGSSVAYADGTWTVTGTTGYYLTLDGAVIDDYLEQGIGSIKYTIGWKDSIPATMSVVIPDSANVLLSYTGASYSGNTVTCNAGFTVTIALTETMARDGLSMQVYFKDRSWSGDATGVDGFTVSYTTYINAALKQNWWVASGSEINSNTLSVTYDESTSTYTFAMQTEGTNITRDIYYLGISKSFISEMTAQGNDSISIAFSGKGTTQILVRKPTTGTAVNLGTYTYTFAISALTTGALTSDYYNSDDYYYFEILIDGANQGNSTELYMTFKTAPAETYSIVYSRNADDTEIEAANMLASHLEEATGVAYDVVSDRYVTWSETAKYISVGQTDLLAEAGYATLADENVSGDGYIRRTLGNTLFIDGISERGTLYGVLDYLEEAYGYVFISDGVYSYTASSDLVISDLDKDFTPTFDTRTYLGYGMFQSNTNGTTALYNRANSYYLNESAMSGLGGNNTVGYVGSLDHNMYEALVEGVALYNAAYGTSYDATSFAAAFTVGTTTNYNPCLSGGLTVDGLTALDFMTLAMKNCILTQYVNGVRYYALAQEDTNGSDYCTCSTCTGLATTYGRSGLMVKFFNEMIAALDADADMKAADALDYRFITLAYQYTKEAPIGGISCDDKLVVRLAFRADDAQDGIANNADKYLEDWSAVASELMYWGYDVDFSAYLSYFASVTGAMADNVKYLKDNHVSFVMIQGAHNADNIWHSQLRAYVYSKLMYYFDETAYAAGADAYVQSLVTEYLTVYYGEYADEVQTVITTYQTAYASVTVKQGTTAIADLVSAQVHLNAYDAVIWSYNDCEDNVMKQRLAAVVASCYAGWIETMTNGQSLYLSTLKGYCDAAGITMWNETATVESVTGS